MKASQLVLGNHYVLIMFPNEKLQYGGLVPEEAPNHVGEHVFFNVKPSRLVPGCVCNDDQVSCVIAEFTEVH